MNSLPMVGRNPYYTMKNKAKPAKPVGSKAQRNRQKQMGMEGAKYNPYLAAILDPEHHPPVGIPDSFSRLTHKSKIIKQQDLNWISGKSSGIVKPRLTEAIASSTTASLTVTDLPWHEYTHAVGSDSGKLVQPNRSTDWYNDSMFPSWNPLYASRNSVLSTTEGAAFRFYSTLKTLSGDDPVHIERVIDPAQAIYRTAGLRIVPGGTVGVAWSLKGTATCGANNLKAYARFYDAVNNAMLTPQTSAFYADANTGSSSLTIIAPANATHLVEYGFIPVVTGTVALAQARIAVVTGAQATHGQFIYSDAGDADEANLLRSLGTTYRVSAQSLWLIYTGAATSNGKIAVAHVQDRLTVGSQDTFNYDFVSKIPGAYSGPLNKGAYCFWKPTDIEDTDFRDGRVEDETCGYLVWAVVANDAAAQNVTARIVTHFEIPTINQAVGPWPSIVRPDWQIEAQMQLANYPSAMENDLHFRAIAQKIADAAKTAGYIAKGVGAGLAATPFSAYAPMVTAVGQAATGFGTGLNSFARMFPN